MAKYFETSDAVKALSSSLEIRPPGGIAAADNAFQRDRAASTLAFSRTREVPLPFDALEPFLKDLSPLRFELQSLKVDFEAAWASSVTFGVEMKKEANALDALATHLSGVLQTPASGSFAGTSDDSARGVLAAIGPAEGYDPLSARILEALGRGTAAGNILPRLGRDPADWFRPRPFPDMSLPTADEDAETTKAIEEAKARAIQVLDGTTFVTRFKRRGDDEGAAGPAPAADPAAAAQDVSADGSLKSVVLRIGERGACWLLAPAVGWSPDELRGAIAGTDMARYDEAWNAGVSSAEPLWEAPFGDFEPWTRVEEVDLNLGAVVDEMKKAVFRREVVASLVGAARTDFATKQAGAAPAGAPGGPAQVRPEDVRAAAESLAEALKQQSDLDDAVRLLQRRAGRLGYLISPDRLEGDKAREFIEKSGGTKYAKLGDGGPAVLIEANRLYKTVSKTYSWSEIYKAKETRGVLVGWTWYRKPIYEGREFEVDRVRQRSEEYDNVEEVPVDGELWMTRLRELANQGRECHVLRLTDGGYRDEQGNRLRDLMTLADMDEGFRSRLVLFHPVYEQSLIEGLVQSKMLVVRAPRSGVKWANLPRLYLEEHYTYRTNWLGTEVGETVSSLNLAPGESRKITVGRNFTYTATRSTSITSVLDVAETSADDLASTIEQERRKEQTESRSLSWNVKASGSYGVVSGEAGANGATSRTSSEFARDFENLARKSARTMARNTSLEVNTSESATTSITRTDESVGEVRNINQGRTMNLLFNRLYNVYRGGIFLEELKVVVLPASETLKGSGIFEPTTYRLLDLSKAVLAVAGDIAEFGSRKDADLPAIAKLFEQSLLDELMSEYVPGSTAETSGARALFPRGALLEGPQDAGAAAPIGSGAAVSDPASRARGGEATASTLSLTIPDRPVTSHVIRVPAAALYLDVALGVGSATEPYSEEARGVELEQRRADVAKTLATASALAVGDRASDDGSRTLREPVILSSETVGGQLVVKLSRSLTTGLWKVSIPGRTLGVVEGGGAEVRLQLEGAAPAAAELALISIPEGLVVKAGG